MKKMMQNVLSVLSARKTSYTRILAAMRSKSWKSVWRSSIRVCRKLVATAPRGRHRRLRRMRCILLKVSEQWSTLSLSISTNSSTTRSHTSKIFQVPCCRWERICRNWMVLNVWKMIRLTWWIASISSVKIWTQWPEPGACSRGHYPLQPTQSPATSNYILFKGTASIVWTPFPTLDLVM